MPGLLRILARPSIPSCRWVVVACLALSAANAAAESPYGIPWDRKLSTTGVDQGLAVATDSAGLVYLAGTTSNNLDGQHPSSTNSDSFLSRYDAAGNLLWLRQFDYDHAYAVTPDRFGNVFVAGTAGADGYISKYSAAGDLLWSRVFDSDTVGFHFLGDRGSGLVVDPQGNAYLSGTTIEQVSGPDLTFLRKYDPDGNQVWSHNVGIGASRASTPLALDPDGNLCVIGQFIAKYDLDGNALWQHPLDPGLTGELADAALAIDALGNLFIGGQVSLDPASTNPTDAFLAKYDAQGNLVWTHQLDSTSYDSGNSVTVDPSGHVYLAGATRGELFGPIGGGNFKDAFLVKYDTDGQQIWGQQFGTTLHEALFSLTADSSGDLYGAGFYRAGLANNSGHGWLMKFSPVPEPSTFALATIGLVGAAALRWRRRHVKKQSGQA